MVFGLGLALSLAHVQRAVAQQNPVTAIDIALEPDATMMQHAKAANARLLKSFPRALRWMRRTNRTSLFAAVRQSIAFFQTSDSRRQDHQDLGKFSTWIKWATPTAETLLPSVLSARNACISGSTFTARDRHNDHRRQ
jgi:hypothetical protein